MSQDELNKIVSIKQHMHKLSVSDQMLIKRMNNKDEGYVLSEWEIENLDRIFKTV